MRDWDSIDINRMFNMIDELMRSDFTGGFKLQSNNQKYPVEIINDNSNIYLTLSIGSIPKEDVFINVTQDNIHFRILSSEREYMHDIDLPSKVEPNSVKSTLRNGVLDIEIKKK